MSVRKQLLIIVFRGGIPQPIDQSEAHKFLYCLMLFSKDKAVESLDRLLDNFEV